MSRLTQQLMGVLLLAAVLPTAWLLAETLIGSASPPSGPTGLVICLGVLAWITLFAVGCVSRLAQWAGSRGPDTRQRAHAARRAMLAVRRPALDVPVHDPNPIPAPDPDPLLPIDD